MTQGESTAAKVRGILEEQGCSVDRRACSDVIAAVADGRETDTAYRGLVAQDDEGRATFVASE